MTGEHEDEELKAAFRAAREAEANWTPSFERVRAGRAVQRARRSRWWLLLPAGLVAALVLTVVRPTPEAPPPWLEVSAGQLRMPTDFLLHVSGVDNLNSIPSIGRVDRWYPTVRTTKDN